MGTRIASAERRISRYRVAESLPILPPPAEENKFRALAENLPQMIFTCDAEGRKNYSCQRYLEYTGCSSFEEIERCWYSCIHPEDRKGAQDAWNLAFQNSTTYMAEVRLRRYDGVYRRQLMHVVPTLNSEGKVTGWVGALTDVHEENKTEALLLRTEKLAAASRMAATLAHEINNPLTSVTNVLFLALQDKALNPTTREYLELADRELLRVAQVTRHSLRFHQQSGKPQSASLGDIMDSVIILYGGQLQTLSIHLDIEYETNEKLLCRVDDLRQAFSHLLSNALDAMSEGGRLQIRIRGAHRWDEAGTLGFKVVMADTGVGIQPEFMPRVFEAFTSTKDSTGTGLGLWVVDEIVRKHKGRIAIRSRTDARHHGTVISLFLPLRGVTT